MKDAIADERFEVPTIIPTTPWVFSLFHGVPSSLNILLWKELGI